MGGGGPPTNLGQAPKHKAAEHGDLLLHKVHVLWRLDGDVPWDGQLLYGCLADGRC